MTPTIAGALAVVVGFSLQDTAPSRPAASSAPATVTLTLPANGLLFQAGTRTPYSGIFKLAKGTQTVQIAPRAGTTVTAPNGETRVVCGLTVFQADARIDPHMVVRIPSSPNVTWAIRAMPAPRCPE